MDGLIKYYKIGGITFRIETDLPIQETTFREAFQHFETFEPGPQEDLVSLKHHFRFPEINRNSWGEKIYEKPPWAIFQSLECFTYVCIGNEFDYKNLSQVAVFSRDYSKADIFHASDIAFKNGGLHSLTLMPTDQLLLTQLLADRDGLIIHASGIDIHGQGLIFVGHSDAGKSTLSRMLSNRGRILCDDRIIIRKKERRFRVYGTWSHGDFPLVSGSDAPLRYIFFLHKHERNRLERLDAPSLKIQSLLPCIIKGLETPDWWRKTLAVIEDMLHHVVCYRLYFSQREDVFNMLEPLLEGNISD